MVSGYIRKSDGAPSSVDMIQINKKEQRKDFKIGVVSECQKIF